MLTDTQIKMLIKHMCQTLQYNSFSLNHIINTLSLLMGYYVYLEKGMGPLGLVKDERTAMICHHNFLQYNRITPEEWTIVERNHLTKTDNTFAGALQKKTYHLR